MITMLPADAWTRVRERGIWDVTATVEARPLRQASSVQVNAILRSRYSTTSGSNYYGGTLEGLPHVLGDWSQAELLINGAIEAVAWAAGDPAAYSAHHNAYGAIPAAVAPVQPTHRVLRFDPQLRSLELQPPGSWMPENQPTDANLQKRAAARQANAFGGLALVRLGQEPTRLPRDSALAILLPGFDASCPSCITPPEVPTLSSFSCAPSTTEDGTAILCSASASAGDFPLAEFDFDWGDGLVSTVAASGGAASSSHIFGLPGTYTIIARAVDTQLRRSAPLSEQVIILPRPPAVSTFSCTPPAPRPHLPGNNGEWVDCTMSVVKGTYDISRYVFDWGDGTVETLPSSALTYTGSHRFDNEGSFTVEVYAIDMGGLETPRVTMLVEPQHTPPQITGMTCAPATAEPGESVSCEITTSDGSTAVQDLTMDWGDGTISTQAIGPGTTIVTHNYHTGSETASDDGDYTITATIEDMYGLQAQETGTITIATVLPSAIVSCTPASGYTGETISCTVTGSAGSHAVGTVHFRWDDGSPDESVAGASGTRAHAYSSDGVYTFEGWVSDVRGDVSALETFTIAIAAATPPTASSIVCAPASVEVGEATSCTISASAGTNPIDSYEIDWGDGSGNYTGGAAGSSHSFGSAGSYIVRGRAFDGGGLPSSWTTTLVSVVVSAVVLPEITSFICATPVEPFANSTCGASANGGLALIQQFEFECVGGINPSQTVPITPAATASRSRQCGWTTTGIKTARVRVLNTDGVYSNWASYAVSVELAASPAAATLSCPASVAVGAGFGCSITVTNGTPIFYAIQWGDGNGTSTSTSSTPVNFSHAYGSETNYTVQAQVSTNLGDVFRSAIITVTSGGAPPPPPPLEPSVSCSASNAARNEAHTATITWNGNGGTVATVTWQVTTPSGGTTGVSSISPGNASGSTSASVPTTEEGVYTIALYAQNTNGESVSVSVGCSYEVQSIPVPEITGINCWVARSPVDQAETLGAGDTWTCQATGSPVGASVTITATLSNPSGGVVNSCTATTLNSAQCSGPMSNAMVGTYTVDAEATASYGGNTSAPQFASAPYVVTATPPAAWSCSVAMISPPGSFLYANLGLSGQASGENMSLTLSISGTATPVNYMVSGSAGAVSWYDIRGSGASTGGGPGDPSGVVFAADGGTLDVFMPTASDLDEGNSTIMFGYGVSITDGTSWREGDVSWACTR